MRLLPGGFTGAFCRLAVRLICPVLVLHLVEVEHYIGLSVQVSIESLERHTNNVSMANTLAGWNFTYLEPYLVYQADIVDGEVGRVSSQIDAVLLIARHLYS